MKSAGFVVFFFTKTLCFMGIESNIVTMIAVHNSSEGSLLNNILQVYTIVLGY